MDGPARNSRVEALHADFERLNVRGFWQSRPADAKPLPRLWRWTDLHPLLMEAAEVIDLGVDTSRRFVRLQTRSMTRSIGFQIVMPGETAEAHRHSASALRFVVQGQGAYTTSNGEPMSMSPGDLLTQPNWVWHDHTNNGDGPAIWIDSLDAGIVRMFNARLYEKWPGGREQSLVKPSGYSPQLYGTLRRPDSRNSSNSGNSPRSEPSALPYHYKWTDTEAALNLLAAHDDIDPCDGVVLEYKNPVTGGHTLTNTTCYIQMLRPGESTKPRRHIGTSMYHVYDGAGLTVVGTTEKTELDWRNKDVFLVPSWEWYFHVNNSDRPAYLFSISDRPIIEAAGLFREELG